MRRSTVAFMLVGAVAFCITTAQGSMVNLGSDGVSTCPWSDVVQGSSAGAPIELTTNTETNSTFTITTRNESDIIWTGYILTLDPAGDATFIQETAGSTKFTNVEYPDPWTIEFWAPKAVKPGETVTLQVDVSLPDAGLGPLTLTHNPIPEPATAALLCLGALALLARRKR